MKTAELKINGMHCQSCVRRVTAAIEKVDGLKSANVAVGSANVEFDPAKTSEEEIAAAVRAIGFELPPGETI
ncbi:MAG: heavy-metal-associated domain-containing protein [Bryobacteraceae bacterium]